jgi:Zn-dependent protease
LVLGSWFLVLGSWFLVLGLAQLILKPETLTLEPFGRIATTQYMEPLPPASYNLPQPAEPPRSPNWKGFLTSIGAVLLVIAKFAAKLKFLILPVLKFFPIILKTGGSMILSIVLYAQIWGWKYALGFVLLIFVHEGGHLIAARMMGLNVGAPVFIPFMGAVIALKEAPRNAWIEAIVGIGGPIAGALGALFCHLVFLGTGEPLWAALAYSGYFLNLFNLIPISPLDGGRIATAVSPWLWLPGLGVLGWMIFHRPFSFILILILISAIPRVISLFRRRDEETQRYFELSREQRIMMTFAYFGLVALLALAMHNMMDVLSHSGHWRH